MMAERSVTRLGDLLHFRPLFKARQQLFCPNRTYLRQFLKGVEIFHFTSEIIFGQLLQTFGDFLSVTLAEREKFGKGVVPERGSMRIMTEFLKYLF